MLDLQLLLDLGIIKSSHSLITDRWLFRSTAIARFFFGGFNQHQATVELYNIQYGIQNWWLMLAIPKKNPNVHQHQPTLARELIGHSGRLSAAIKAPVAICRTTQKCSYLISRVQMTCWYYQSISRITLSGPWNADGCNRMMWGKTRKRINKLKRWMLSLQAFTCLYHGTTCWWASHPPSEDRPTSKPIP